MRKEHLVPLLRQAGFIAERETNKGWLIGRCPFTPYIPGHKNRPDHFCAKINDSGKSGFNCYSCKLSGSIIQFFLYLQHYSRNEKFGQLSAEAGLKELTAGSTREFDTPPTGVRKPKPLSEKVFHDLFPPAWQNLASRTYLKNRGIGEQTCEMLGIVFDPEESRIVFPIRDRENRLYGFTGRTILKDEVWKKRVGYGKVKDYGFDQDADGGKQFFILGAHLVDLTKPLLLVEGLFALAHMIEIGADSIVQPIASMGSSLSDYQAGILEDWGKPVYLLYDRDEAGRNGQFGYTKPPKPGKEVGEFVPGSMHKLWQLVPTYRMRWPKGYTDPDKLNFDHIKLMFKDAPLVSF